MNRNQRYCLEVDQAAKVAQYNAATFHPKYSRRCATCGKFFAGGDWRFAETQFCSEACELAACKRLDPFTRYQIKMFWRDFGKDIKPYGDD
ncbi:MAG: hypothetical protein II968_05180 [Selenomonadaceae bacterium]|nr:hypothetical protein [Selenomonadaceae bacterium]